MYIETQKYMHVSGHMYTVNVFYKMLHISRTAIINLLLI